jgi:hypothetical protein
MEIIFSIFTDFGLQFRSIQELVLARSEPLLFIGNQLVLWASVLGATLYASDQLLSPEPSLLEHQGFSPSTIESVQQLITRIDRLGEIRRLHTKQATSIGLYGSLCMSQGAVATDPRDKVFGLLGICKFKGAAPITPDYSTTVQQVFTKATIVSILEKSAIPYYDFTLDPPKGFTKVPYLPSWVLDFTLYSKLLVNGNGNRFLDSYRNKSTYAITQSTENWWDRKRRLNSVRFSEDLRTLYTHGIYIGTISVSRPCPLGPGLKTHTSISGKRIGAVSLYDVYKDILKPRGIPRGALIRAFPYGHLYQKDYDDLVLERREMRQSQRERTPMSLSEVRFHNIARECTFFVTREGQIGSSFHPDFIGIEPGDVLVALFGLEVPFVLRPISGTSTYKMINVAFLSGHGNDVLFDEFSPLSAGLWTDLAAEGLPEYAIV